MVNELALIAGIGGLVYYLLYLAEELNKKPRLPVEHKISKWLQPHHWAVFVKLITTWIVVGGVGFLAQLSSGQTYEPLFNNLFVAMIYINVAYNILYLVLYLMFTVTTHLEDVAKWRYWK